jgi:hypothetical protein
MLPASAQTCFEQTAPLKYRIEFTDKHNSPFSLNAPDQFLSPKAIERRQKQDIPIVWNDLPVNPAYLDSIRATGAVILTVSKWFNALTIAVPNDSVLDKICRLSFVVRKSLKGSLYNSNYAMKISSSGGEEILNGPEFDYGVSWWQTALHNGDLLHNRGFTGKDMVIAVIDAGFANVDKLPVFDHLFEKGRILGTRDFVKAGNNVYHESSHGMSVLSIMGGYLPGELIGTAPDASFWLLRSEDGDTEYIIEEDNWIAAAEFADSAGADIINSSLGYSVFNDSAQNHTYEDMDGNTTRVSRGADIAASKGILVVNSAGNQGNVSWKYITAPADADSILSVGAVDEARFVADFSSRGPTSDQQVKPTVMALGEGTYVARLDSTVRGGNGTSFSAPVIAGLAACLWQTIPRAGNMDIIRVIIESSDRKNSPNSDYGYGVPDFSIAEFLLRAEYVSQISDSPVVVFPNPFSEQLYIFFESPVNDNLSVRLFDLAGKEVFRKEYPPVPERNFVLLDSDFDHLQKGVYIIKVNAGHVSGNSKLIKF